MNCFTTPWRLSKILDLLKVSQKSFISLSIIEKKFARNQVVFGAIQFISYKELFEDLWESVIIASHELINILIMFSRFGEGIINIFIYFINIFLFLTYILWKLHQQTHLSITKEQFIIQLYKKINLTLRPFLRNASWNLLIWWKHQRRRAIGNVFLRQKQKHSTCLLRKIMGSKACKTSPKFLMMKLLSWNYCHIYKSYRNTELPEKKKYRARLQWNFWRWNYCHIYEFYRNTKFTV